MSELNYDDWLKDQDEATQALITDHIAGLKTALTSEREERKQLARQLKGLSGQGQTIDTLQTKLTGITESLELKNAQLVFYGEAQGKVKDLSLAWLAAREAGLVNGGTVDLAKLKETHPILFAPPPPVNGGNQGGGESGDMTMNDLIRARAGRR